ncbi:MAG: DUF1211 domain-containing protein [Bacteroidetes bacterium]|nr:DUF1211 domain-containing protein [Bacteroidota bacterium]
MEKRNTLTSGTSRLEAFTDGVFAIAITLLVLDIHVPVPGRSLVQGLLADWPTFLAFLVGFFTILVCWINHHYMFQFIRRSNGQVLLLNGLKLLVVSVTPFVTAVLSKYLQGAESGTAVVIYTGNFALMGSTMGCLWHYASRNGLATAESATVLRANDTLYLLSCVVSLGIFFVSLISVTTCLVLSAGMFGLFLFPERTAQRIARRHHSASHTPIVDLHG